MPLPVLPPATVVPNRSPAVSIVNGDVGTLPSVQPCNAQKLCNTRSVPSLGVNSK